MELINKTCVCVVSKGRQEWNLDSMSDPMMPGPVKMEDRIIHSARPRV